MRSQSKLELEKVFQKNVLLELRELRRSWWVKLHDMVTWGLPDIAGVIGGQFVAIELKTRSKVSKLQRVTGAKISRAGGRFYIVDPTNWEKVFLELELLSQSAD